MLELEALPTIHDSVGGRSRTEIVTEVVARCRDAGRGVVLATFGLGEGHLLSDDERREVWSSAVAAAGGRIPVWAAGIEFGATRRVLAQCRTAVACGVDGVVVPPPRPGAVGARPRIAEIDGYYTTIFADHTVGTMAILLDDAAEAGWPLDPALVAAIGHRVLTFDDDPLTVWRLAETGVEVFAASPCLERFARTAGLAGWVRGSTRRPPGTSAAGFGAGFGAPRRPYLDAPRSPTPASEPVRVATAPDVAADAPVPVRAGANTTADAATAATPSIPRQAQARALITRHPMAAMAVTPFAADGELDRDALGAHVDALASAGVAVYLGSFGTGEGQLLDDDELDALYRSGVEAAAGRVPVVAAGLGFSSTAMVIEQAQHAAACGVTAVQIHPPRPGARGVALRPDEVERYYDDVLGAVRSPVLLTNQVAMTGSRLAPELVANLVHQHAHVIGLNTTDPDPAMLGPMLAAIAGRVPVFSGMLGQLPQLLALGGTGGLCFEANVVPDLCVAAHRALTENEADPVPPWLDLLRIHDVLMRHQNPRSVKAALDLLGRPGGGPLRPPYLRSPPEAVAEIAAVLAAVGLRSGAHQTNDGGSP